LERMPPLIGDPVLDWSACRGPLNCHGDVQELFKQARMIKLFRATDALAKGLNKIWSASGTYVGAATAVRRILDQERLIGFEREPRGCLLMTLHKSKGKEFDGVVLVEGYRDASFFRADEAPLYEASRRLLRVGITRARKFVVLVRSNRATPLVS
jgi:DNA helicase-2/ATP-dependent DNA helicase PcrA